MAEAALGKLDKFTAQGLSNMVWAFATVGHYNPALAQQLAAQVRMQTLLHGIAVYSVKAVLAKQSELLPSNWNMATLGTSVL